MTLAVVIIGNSLLVIEVCLTGRVLEDTLWTPEKAPMRENLLQNWLRAYPGKRW
jgi:hypothetical protein